jgi:hypothetical protein
MSLFKGDQLANATDMYMKLPGLSLEHGTDYGLYIVGLHYNKYEN